MKVNGKWGGQEPGRTTYENMPPHKTRGGLPAGGNELFCDGHVEWVKAESMYFLTTWDLSRVCYFYQDPRDFDQGLRANLKFLAFQP